MKIKHLLAALLFTLFGSLHVAMADDWPDSEKSALANQIKVFGTAFSEGDLETVIGVVPDKIFSTIAKNAGVSLPEFRKSIITTMKQTMDTIEVVSFGMDLDQAIFGQTSIERKYALVPTRSVMIAHGAKIQNDTHTLAFFDEGAWALVRIDNTQQIALLTNAYPDFKGVDFPSGSSQVLE